MKKVTALISTLTYYAYSASAAFAQAGTPSPGIIKVEKPGVGYGDINSFMNAAIRLAFIVAIVSVLIMLVWGAIEWIFSGGNKDNVKTARERIMHALIGFAILAVAFAIASFAGSFVGINILKDTGFTVPNPSNPAPSI